MTEVIGEGATILGGIAVAVAIVVGVKLFRRVRTRRERELVRVLDERLAEDVPAGLKTHLDDVPTVRRVTDEGSDETLVPTVRIDLETSDAPGLKLVFEYVAAVLESIHPVLDERDADVRRYDVEFTVGPDGLLVEGECRRVSVPVALAEGLCEDEQYRVHDLRRDVERAAERGGPAAVWEECL